MKRWLLLPVFVFITALGGCSPGQSVANAFWPSSPAPWEDVDAFFYPDRNDLSQHFEMRDLSSIQKCRDWAISMAAAQGDPYQERSDYECGVGRVGSFGSVGVYRLTIR